MLRLSNPARVERTKRKFLKLKLLLKSTGPRKAGTNRERRAVGEH